MFYRILLLLQLICLTGFSQVSEEHYLQGLALEKQFKVEAALAKYELALQTNPKHGEAYIHASRMLSNIGGRLPKSERSKKREYYEKAKLYADKATSILPRNPDAHLADIVALGLLSEIAINPHEKVRDARNIHQAALKILSIDSTYAEAYFVLGKWQFELSRLNWMELMACKFFFGGFPEEISNEAAQAYFLKAIQYKNDSILFLFGLASAQHVLGEEEKAIATLKKALALPLAEPDDEQRKQRCENLLNEILK